MEAPAISNADRGYWAARAEQELRLSRSAAGQAASASHFRLAAACLEQAAGRSGGIPVAEVHQPFACCRGAVTCLGASPADYQKWEGLILAVARMGSTPAPSPL